MRPAYMWTLVIAVGLIPLAVVAGCAEETAVKAVVTLNCEPLEGSDAVTAEQVEQAATILTDRLDGVGSARPGGGDTIVLSLKHAIADEGRLALLLAVGRLELVLVPQDLIPVDPRDLAETTWVDGGTNEEVEWPDVLERGEAICTHDGLKPNAEPQKGPPAGTWDVRFELTDEKKPDFRAATRANVGRILAIVLDDQPLMAPVIRSEIPGAGVISSDFTKAEARQLASTLNTEPLPVTVTVADD